MFYGSDMHRVFHSWWTNAGAGYVPFHDGRPADILTLYYDPLLNYHHRVGLGGGLSLAFQLVPQARNEARGLFEAAVEKMGWTGSGPVREVTRDFTSQLPTPLGTLLGLALAREFGNAAVYTKLKEYVETRYEPTWHANTGEFTWGFGLNELHPRGQLNAGMMTAEAGSEGAWWRVFNQPNLGKFVEPTVHSVDFPTVCLSQAWYDSERRCLIVTTDAGAPGAQGQPTSFRVSQLDPQRCTVLIDGEPSDGWRVVDGELEITDGRFAYVCDNAARGRLSIRLTYRLRQAEGHAYKDVEVVSLGSHSALVREWRDHTRTRHGHRRSTRQGRARDRTAVTRRKETLMKTGYMLAMQNAHEGMSDAEMIRNELRIAAQAEAFGFDVVWCAEHHFDHYSIAPDNFQLLTWLAARTTNIQLGTAAVILPWNDPLRLVEKASVLDAVSEGRFVLGLGRGLARMEYEAFGIDMNEARGRFDESARMIVNALETGFIEGSGPHYPQKRTEIRPKPLYSFKDKLYSVAMSPDSITAAAHLGARMMFFIQFALERHLPMVESYRQQFLQKHGTNAPPPHAIDFVVCDRDAGRAEELARKHLSAYYLSLLRHYELQEGYHADLKGYESYGAAAQLIKKMGIEGAVNDYISHQVWGTPQQIFDKLAARQRVIGEFEWNMVMSFGGIPFDVVEASTRLISQEVLPELRTWTGGARL